VNRVNAFIWGGLGLVALAYILMALVQDLLPFLLVAVVLVVIYRVMFNRRI